MKWTLWRKNWNDCSVVLNCKNPRTLSLLFDYEVVTRDSLKVLHIVFPPYYSGEIPLCEMEKVLMKEIWEVANDEWLCFKFHLKKTSNDFFFFFAEVMGLFYFPVIQGTDLAVTPWGRPKGTHAGSKKYGARNLCKQVAWDFVLHLKSQPELLRSLQVLVSVAQELSPAAHSVFGAGEEALGWYNGREKRTSWVLQACAELFKGGWGKMTLQTFEDPGIREDIWQKAVRAMYVCLA